MSTGEGEDVLIDEHLVARKDPDREAWEITDAEGAYRGRVVETAGGFQALKPFGKEFYSVGTFVSLEKAALVVVVPQGRAGAEERGPLVRLKIGRANSRGSPSHPRSRS